MSLSRFGLRLVDFVCGPRIDRQAREHVDEILRRQTRSSRERANTVLARLGREAGPRILLGETPWRARVEVPLEELMKAHAIITGGTGAGKSMVALNLIEAILRAAATAIRERRSPGLSFGVLDAKGELFERSLFLLAQLLTRLSASEAEALRSRIVIVDLSSPDPVTSYNIASPWSGSDLDFFSTSRVETLEELLPSGDGFSLRGGAIAKHVLKLLAEHRLPFSYFDRALSSDTFRAKLLARSRDEDLRYYFRMHFPGEPRATISAVRSRLNSALLGSMSLKLALSGPGAPDLRALQDEGKIVLINCAGPNIPRPTARTLQALFLSDIRQAVFTRQNHATYLWICDEAQNFFRTRQLRENMTDLLTMSRSYGSFFLYLTQNLSTAVQDREMLETLYTNIRWSLSLRGTTQDGAFLKPALPVTGRRPRPRNHPYAPVEFYKPQEERELLAQEITHLADRTGWLWLKSLTGEAFQLTTRRMDLPSGAQFSDAVNAIRNDPRIGGRVSRASFLAETARRDAEWITEEEPDAVESLKKECNRLREAS